MILAGEKPKAQQAREAAGSWWKKLPRTLDRYLRDDTLAPYRDELRPHILSAIEQRFTAIGLLPQQAAAGNR